MGSNVGGGPSGRSALYNGRVDFLPLHQRLGLFQAGFHGLGGEPRVGLEQSLEIKVLDQSLEHKLDGDSRPLDHGLSRENVWVNDR